MDKIFRLIFAGTAEDLSAEIDSGADINARDRYRRTPLTNAIMDNKLEMAKVLIQRGADVNAQDRAGWAALHFAAQNDSLTAVQLLVANGASVDLLDANGNSPLFRAVFSFKDKPDVIRELLAAGADRNLENKHGISPLKLAKSITNYNIAQFFQ